jgi:Xaa-Pro aminopeptidase
MTLGEYEALHERLKSVNLVSTKGLVEQLREIKDKHEVGETRAAIQQAEQAFAVIRASLRHQRTEREVAHEIENQIRLFGGIGCSFPPIVAVGPRSALPHARPTSQRIGECDFTLFDWGARSAGGYMSDLTRVLVTGKISPKLERIYGLVLKAQLSAIAAIRPGATMKDVDAVARNLIAKAGHEKQFGHGLGHGLGLAIHEGPRLAKNEDRELKAGMIVTVEPGIYVPGWGGVRIEDDVLVTRDGHEVLTSVRKELADCLVG